MADLCGWQDISSLGHYKAQNPERAPFYAWMIIMGLIGALLIALSVYLTHGPFRARHKGAASGLGSGHALALAGAAGFLPQEIYMAVHTFYRVLPAHRRALR